MKKISIICILFLLGLFAFKNFNLNVKADVDDNVDGYLEPAFGDEDPTYSEDEGLFERDQYERNNSFKRSTDISVHDENEPEDEENVEIYGTLHKGVWILNLIRNVDQDYYRIDVFGKAHISISLDIPEDVNYNFDLWKHNDSVDTGWSDTDIFTVGYGNEEGVGETETFTTNDGVHNVLSPGTYYIRVYSANDLYYSNDEYKLTYNIDYQIDEPTSISKIRFNYGAKAAVWKSDFIPYGEKVLALSGEIDVRQSKVPFHNTIDQYSTDYGVVIGVIYIWDTTWRNAMADYIDSLLTAIGNQYDDAMNVRVSFEKYNTVAEGVSLGLNIIGTATSTPVLNIVGEAVSLSGDASIAISRLLVPDEWITTLGEAKNYFIMLRNVLECVENEDSTEVVSIRCKYQYKNRKISFMPVIDSSEVFLYSDDLIYSYNTESHTYGKVNILDELTDFNDIFEEGTVGTIEEVNTCDPIDISLNQIKTGNLIPGKYYWYKFIAPSTGTYNFYSSSDIDTYGELFSAVDPARKIDHRLANGYNDDSGDGSNFLISYQLTANQVVYLRVRGYNWVSSGTFAVTVDKVHIHSYTYSYEQDSSTKHKAYCSCGSYISEDHTLVNGTCSKCGETETTTHTHNFIYTSCGDGATHRKRCLCGYLSTEPCMGLYEPGNGTVCTKCGQNMSNGGALLNGFTGDENIVLYRDEEDNLI